MQAPKFKRGDKVKTPKGRGEVAKVTKTEKGVWYTIAHKEGSTKMRGASLSPGFTCMELLVAISVVSGLVAVFG